MRAYPLGLILGKNLSLQCKATPGIYPALHNSPHRNLSRSPIFWKTPDYRTCRQVSNNPRPACADTPYIYAGQPPPHHHIVDTSGMTATFLSDNNSHHLHSFYLYDVIQDILSYILSV